MKLVVYGEPIKQSEVKKAVGNVNFFQLIPVFAPAG